MKKWIAWTLAWVLALTCGTAWAEVVSDAQALAHIASRVKATVPVSDEYTEFNGEYEQRMSAGYWSLRWTGDQKSLYVKCDDEGTILSYELDDRTIAYDYSGHFAPRLTDNLAQSALTAARAFLDRAVASPWGVELDEQPLSPISSDLHTLWFNGTLTYNGHPTDLFFGISLYVETLDVNYYYRNDQSQQYNGYDTAESLAVTSEAAGASLAETYRMGLRYVTDGDDLHAVLRYLPEVDGDYVVLAHSGERIDLNHRFDQGLSESEANAKTSMAADRAEDSAYGASLTDVELSGVERIAGLMSAKALDESARAIEALGLSDTYRLNNVRFVANDDKAETGYDVRMTYYRTLDKKALLEEYQVAKSMIEDVTHRGENFYIVKTVRLDAATGTLKAVRTSYPYIFGDYDYDVDVDACAAIAEDFLARQDASIAASVMQTQAESRVNADYYTPIADFTYTRVADGIRYDSNFVSLSVNADTHTIDRYETLWTKDLTFDLPEGVIGEDAALEAYLAEMTPTLKYVSLPTVESLTYYDYQYDLTLCYAMTGHEDIYGMDAKTGAPVRYSAAKTHLYAYDDVEETSIPYILAEYGVGLPGGRFLGQQPITAREFIALLLQLTNGYNDIWTATDRELIDYARSYRILSKTTYDLAAPLTRGQVVTILLNMSGYDTLASLRGIYQSHFTDEATFTDGEYGYIAIAEGMGIAQAHADGRFAPHDVATRADAMAMIYAFLTRTV